MDRTELQSEGWACFSPSGAVSWRSFETSREASIRAFCGDHWAAYEASGWRCINLRFVPAED